MVQPKPITGGILLQDAPAAQGGAHSSTYKNGPSNVLRLLVQVPPGNPQNYRVRITGIP